MELPKIVRVVGYWEALNALRHHWLSHVEVKHIVSKNDPALITLGLESNLAMLCMKGLAYKRENAFSVNDRLTLGGHSKYYDYKLTPVGVEAQQQLLGVSVGTLENQL